MIITDKQVRFNREFPHLRPDARKQKEKCSMVFVGGCSSRELLKMFQRFVSDINNSVERTGKTRQNGDGKSTSSLCHPLSRCVNTFGEEVQFAQRAARGNHKWNRNRIISACRFIVSCFSCFFAFRFAFTGCFFLFYRGGKCRKYFPPFWKSSFVLTSCR